MSPPAAQTITDPPWAQHRFGLDRLTGIADGRGVTVAVIDSGVQAGTPQLGDRVLAGVDELVPDGDGRQDCVGHGTAVASLIAAAPGSGSAGLRGVAPAVRILPIRVTETDAVTGTGGRPGSAHGLADAIRTAVDPGGARVLNISMVLSQDDAEVADAVRFALAHQAVVVAAAGNAHRDNGGPDPVSYPAAYPGVIGVGAIDADGQRLAESQVGTYVRLSAPGGSVTAAVPGGLATFSGTSFAVPFVSGAAALVVQRYPTLTGAQVATRLYATADPAPDRGRSASYGYGIVNPYRAATGAGPQAAASPASPLPVAAPAATRDSQALPLRLALLAAGVGALGAVLLLLFAVVVPRGSRRGWRPGS